MQLISSSEASSGQALKNFSISTELEGSFPRFQQHATGLYSEPNKSSSHMTISFP
jgi:hypothetical protein